MKIPIETSNRHVHLSRKDIDLLFGEGYCLNVLRELSQPGEFAAEERVSLLHNGFEISDVRVLGPARDETQVELLTRDLDVLGFDCPVKTSGDLEDTPGLRIRGLKGEVTIEKGVIIANRHLHLTEEDALGLGLKSNVVSMKVGDKILDNVVVRIDSNARLAVHINKDDEFAEFVDVGTCGELVEDNLS